MKIKNLRDKIKAEQSVKESDQHEYRRLSHSKHSSKLTRLKQVFETKNRKSSNKIERLQQRLHEYEAKVKNYEEISKVDDHASRLQRYSSESNILQTRGVWTNQNGDQPASLIINRIVDNMSNIKVFYFIVFKGIGHEKKCPLNIKS